MHHLKIPYTSGWYTVVLPTLICLGVWGGLYLGILALLGWNVPGWLGVLLCFGGFIPGLAVAVVTYPFLMRLAERGRGELILEGDRLRWRTGRRWHEVDFTQPHKARIAAGTSGLSRSNATITLYPDVQEIHLPGARREDVLAFFPEAYFVDEMAVLPEEGTWGFVLSVDDPEAVHFFQDLLECLWRHREGNESFRLYRKFPWDHHPRPAFRHIRIIDWQTATPEEQAFVESLNAQVASSLGDVQLTPDYLLAWLYPSLRSKLDGRPDGWCIMPLGHIRVEVSLPRPDWKPFIVGHILKGALASALGAATPAGGPYLKDRRYLYVRGQGEDGRPLELAFEWYGPEDREYDEAELLVRFIQTRGRPRPRGRN